MLWFSLKYYNTSHHNRQVRVSPLCPSVTCPPMDSTQVRTKNHNMVFSPPSLHRLKKSLFFFFFFSLLRLSVHISLQFTMSLCSLCCFGFIPALHSTPLHSTPSPSPPHTSDSPHLFPKTFAKVLLNTSKRFHDSGVGVSFGGLGGAVLGPVFSGLWLWLDSVTPGSCQLVLTVVLTD